MIYFYKKNFVVKFTALMCSVVIIILSPCAKYFDVSSIDTVYATGLEIPLSLGAEAVLDYLVAFFATLGVEETFRNREAISEAYGSYLDSKAADIPDVSEPCLQFYDVAKGQDVLIPWSDVTDSLHNYHDVAVDELTGFYAKYCPALLGNMKDFVTDVFSGDVYIEGLSESIIDVTPVTANDIAEQWKGVAYTYNLSDIECSGSGSIYFCPITKGDHRYFKSTSFSYKRPLAISSESGFCGIWYYNDGMHSYSYGYDTKCSFCGLHNYLNGSLPFTSTFSSNIPIFSTFEACSNYLKTGVGYENSLNFGQSMYDNITDNVDLPPFYKTWQQELWERVANAPDVGIGSYGYGVGVDANDWADDIPFVGLGSLWDYIDSVQDVYEKVIDDIINGVYDPTKDIPDTYDDAWEDSVADTWDDVVDLPVDVPDVKDPSIPVNPDKPINPDEPIEIPDDSVIDIPIEDIVPTVNDSFIDIAGSIKYKFPFSIPWDIHHIFTVLADTPKAPCFELPIVVKRHGISEKIIVDMSRFQTLSDLSRSMFSMIFAIYLINLTFKVVAMRKEE